MSNENIIRHFVALKNKKSSEGDHWRVKAYSNAINIIKKCGFKIESGEQAQTLKGIGKNIGEKIDEILLTGRLDGISIEDLTETQNALELFETIFGVGPKTAQLWYDNGYRKLSDIDLEKCNDVQKLGIKYRTDICQRIPREEVKLIEKKLIDHCLPLGIEFKICGSYRRGCDFCGDVDILVTEQDGRNVVDEILTCNLFVEKLGRGSKKYLGIGKLGENYLYRRIDIELVKQEEYAYALFYFTGPGAFNVKMRDLCSGHGYCLNEKALIDPNGDPIKNADGSLYTPKTEEDIFGLLRVPYLTPEQRNEYEKYL